MTAPAQNLETSVAQLRRAANEPSPFGESHQRVLAAAMELMAERGYAAASLRELARRLEMSQPSLYHYFESKEQLVEQIVRWQAAVALRAPDNGPSLPTLKEGLELSLQRMLENYRTEEHVVFVRFMHLVARERPEFRALAHDLFYARGLGLLQRFTRLYVDAGQLRAQDSDFLAEAALNAMLMRLMGHQVLFGDGEAPADSEAFADFIVDALVRGVRARREDDP